MGIIEGVTCIMYVIEDNDRAIAQSIKKCDL